MGTILYYHYANVNISLSRNDFQFGWNNICFAQENDGWPSVCSPGTNPLEIAQLVDGGILSMIAPGLP